MHQILNSPIRPPDRQVFLRWPWEECKLVLICYFGISSILGKKTFKLCRRKLLLCIIKCNLIPFGSNFQKYPNVLTHMQEIRVGLVLNLLFERIYSCSWISQFVLLQINRTPWIDNLVILYLNLNEHVFSSKEI